jgi:hypothetical protein
MKLRVGHGLAICALLGLVGGCVNYGELSQATLAACSSEAGITGVMSVGADVRDGRTAFTVLPGTNVTQSQADIATACIARTNGGGSMAAPAAAPSMSRPAPTVGTQCIKGGGPMQGGAGYC